MDQRICSNIKLGCFGIALNGSLNLFLFTPIYDCYADIIFFYAIL